MSDAHTPILPDINPINMSNGYSDTIVTQIGKVYEKCMSLKWCHSKESDRCRKLGRRLRLPSYILSSLVGTGSMVSLINGYSTFTVIEFAINILTIISSILSALDNYSDFTKKENSHENYKTRFSEICNDIETCMSCPIENRENGVTFLKTATIKLNNLTGSGVPSISQGVEDSFRKLLRVTIGKNKTYETDLKVHKLLQYSPRPMRRVMEEDSEREFVTRSSSGSPKKISSSVNLRYQSPRKNDEEPDVVILKLPSFSGNKNTKSYPMTPVNEPANQTTTSTQLESVEYGDGDGIKDDGYGSAEDNIDGPREMTVFV